MAYNELNLYFGPKLPLEFETVGLAFIAAPNLRSDTAIGALSAIRYARENYDHVEQLSIFDAGYSQAKLNVQYTSSNINAFSSPSSAIPGEGAYSSLGTITLTDEYWGPELLNSAIKVNGMRITPAGTWYPLVQPGLVFRSNYVLAASGIEPANSWLKRVFDPNGTSGVDQFFTLIYSVPEVLYSSTVSGNVGNTFPPSQAKYKTVKEIATPTSPNTISYEGNLEVLKSITINGTVKASGLFTGNEAGSGDVYFRVLDKIGKEIKLRSSIAPDDTVELEYLSYSDYYVYTGFRDVSGNWWPFDANPEYGHYIGNSDTNGFDLSSDALLNQITIYAIPTAAIKHYFVEAASGSNTIGTLHMQVYRAVDYGETHFVRHMVSSEPVEKIEARDGGSIINTWGHAYFGRNYYDEQNQYGGDIFSFTVPSMIPLGRFVLAAPAATKSVAIADIRERGGGVPMDFPMVGVDSQEDGIDKLRGFLDMGIWEGKAVKEGGVVEVQIDKSLLKTDLDSLDPTTFLASEIYDIVKSQIPPGIDFEIKYVENM
jgi:hypothetical protein